MLGKSLDRSISQEDILTGNNEWQNIQEIVRLTFRQMSNTVQAQERAIQNLERQISLKVSRAELQSFMASKIDTEEFHVEMNNLRNIIQSIRSETSDLICANREDYINDYRKILGELDSKANKNEVKSQLNDLDYQRNLNTVEIKELRKETDSKLQALKGQISLDIDYTREMNMIEFDKILEGNKMILNEINENKLNSQDLFENLFQKVKGNEDEIDMLSQVHAKSEEEAKKNLTSSLTSVRNELTETIKQAQDNINKIFREIDQIKAAKADSSHMFSLIQMKSDELALLREEMNFQSSQIKTKTAVIDFEKEVRGVKEALELQKREVNLKFDKKVGEIHSELATKVAKEEHGGSLAKQDEINETLCSENTIARWSFANRRNLNGEVVWEKLNVNTCPDNFLWQNGYSDITITNQGCYELCLGFYSEKKPQVRVIVNNQSVFSLVNSPMYALHGSTVSGVTLTEFISLESNSSIKITCEGDQVTSAFLSIRKI